MLVTTPPCWHRSEHQPTQKLSWIFALLSYKVCPLQVSPQAILASGGSPRLAGLGARDSLRLEVNQPPLAPGRPLPLW